MFKSPNEFCAYLDQLKDEHHFDTYIQTIAYYSEHESDQEMDDIVKHLNKKIRDRIEVEAVELKLVKAETVSEPLFV